MPLRSSSDGGCQLNRTEVVPVTEAVKFSGGALGTACRTNNIITKMDMKSIIVLLDMSVLTTRGGVAGPSPTTVEAEMVTS